MKILALSNLYPPDVVGGYELACAATLNQLVALGHEVTVLTSDTSVDLSSRRSEPGGAGVIRRNLLLHWNWGAQFSTRSLRHASRHNWFAYQELLSEIDPDIVYAWNLYGLGSGFCSRLLSQTTPRVIHHIMDESFMAYPKYFERITGAFRVSRPRRVDTAIFCSRYLSSHLSQKLNVRESHVVYPTVDDLWLRTWKTSYSVASSLKIVYLGQFVPHKGVHTLLSSLPEISNSLSQFVELDIYTTSQLSELELDHLQKCHPNVRILRGLSPAEIGERLPGYDLAIFPSIWNEPFGIAQIELMAAGLPVLSSLRGGSGEVFDGKNLVVIDPEDPTSISRAVIDLVHEYSYIGKRLGENARAYVLESHDPTRNAKVIESVLSNRI